MTRALMRVSRCGAYEMKERLFEQEPKCALYEHADDCDVWPHCAGQMEKEKTYFCAAALLKKKLVPPPPPIVDARAAGTRTHPL